MARYLSSEKQSRFDSLIALFSNGDISDEEEVELITLRKELQKNKLERVEQLNRIQAQISELDVEIVELYSRECILAVAKTLESQINSKAAFSTKKSNNEKNVRESDGNEVLLVLTHAAGDKGPGEWSYRQGRVYERASSTTSQPWAMRPKQYPSKLLKIGTSVEALRAYCTPAGTAYFATEAGQAELAKLVEVTAKARAVLLGAGI